MNSIAFSIAILCQNYTNFDAKRVCELKFSTP
jgi:hypothetical protein